MTHQIIYNKLMNYTNKPIKKCRNQGERHQIYLLNNIGLCLNKIFQNGEIDNLSVN